MAELDKHFYCALLVCISIQRCIGLKSANETFTGGDRNGSKLLNIRENGQKATNEITDDSTDFARSDTFIMRNKRHLTAGFENEYYSPPQHAEAIIALDSCSSWRQRGPASSGYYWIDPDGRDFGEPPMKVFCEMETGTTIIHHDSEDLQQGEQCSGAQCYSKRIEYSATIPQIVSLMNSSSMCYQYIKIECLETPLNIDGVTLSTWVDRHGKHQEFWVGDREQHECLCGQSNSCIDPTKRCNCDSNIKGEYVEDNGYISSMTSLPVQVLKFGSESDQRTEIQFMLGPLLCYDLPSPALPKSCEEVYQSGTIVSGHYELQRQNGIEWVYCDMERLDEVADVLPLLQQDQGTTESQIQMKEQLYEAFDYIEQLEKINKEIMRSNQELQQKLELELEACKRNEVRLQDITTVSSTTAISSEVTTTFVWQISDYSSKKMENKNIFSQPFFHGSGRCLYKLRLNAQMNGYGGTKGYISVFIQLMPTDFDDILQWPLTGNLKFTLLPQHKGLKLEQSMALENYGALDKPGSNSYYNRRWTPNNRPYGFSEGFAHSLIENDSFLVNDTIYMEVTISTSS